MKIESINNLNIDAHFIYIKYNNIKFLYSNVNAIICYNKTFVYVEMSIVDFMINVYTLSYATAIIILEYKKITVQKLWPKNRKKMVLKRLPSVERRNLWRWRRHD